jgi:hypothetical protein
LGGIETAGMGLRVGLMYKHKSAEKRRQERWRFCAFLHTLIPIVIQSHLDELLPPTLPFHCHVHCHNSFRRVELSYDLHSVFRLLCKTPEMRPVDPKTQRLPAGRLFFHPRVQSRTKSPHTLSQLPSASFDYIGTADLIHPGIR